MILLKTPVRAQFNRPKASLSMGVIPLPGSSASLREHALLSPRPHIYTETKNTATPIGTPTSSWFYQNSLANFENTFDLFLSHRGTEEWEREVKVLCMKVGWEPQR